MGSEDFQPASELDDERECQYHLCEKPADGGLSTHFGDRWYCTRHYVLMIESLDKKPDVIEGPTDD